MIIYIWLVVSVLASVLGVKFLRKTNDVTVLAVGVASVAGAIGLGLVVMVVFMKLAGTFDVVMFKRDQG